MGVASNSGFTKNSFVIFLVVPIHKNKLQYAGFYLLGKVGGGGMFYPKLNIFPPQKNFK